MTVTNDVMMAAIAANVGACLGGRQPLEATFGAVRQLRDDVLGDASATSSTIVRHHMYAPLEDKTVHCFYERIGKLGTMSFYVTADVFEAESITPMDMTFVGSCPVAGAHNVN